MRTVIFVAAALLLCGCDTGDGWVPDESAGTVAAEPPAPVAVASAPAPVAVPPRPVYAPPPPVVAAAEPVVPPAPFGAPPPPVPGSDELAAVAAPSPYEQHCKAVAHQRAADARANGYSFEMADTIYDGTFKDCVTWDTQHGPTRMR